MHRCCSISPPTNTTAATVHEATWHPHCSIKGAPGAGAQPVALAASAAGGGAPEEALLTVKYLSSPVLLRLQLSDAAARRHFCLQARPSCPNAAPYPVT